MRGRKPSWKQTNDSFVRYPVWSEDRWMYFDSINDIPNIRIKNPLIGFVYALEFGDMTKIGFTADPRERMMMLKGKALKYAGTHPGRIFISPAHRHYAETENALHKHFKEYRIPHTELFRIKFSEKISTMMCMAIEQHICGSAIAEITEEQNGV